MIKFENDCVDCGLPCLGNTCPLRKVPHFYCDDCGNEDILYHYKDRQLCEFCLLSRHKEVTIDDIE